MLNIAQLKVELKAPMPFIPSQFNPQLVIWNSEKRPGDDLIAKDSRSIN